MSDTNELLGGLMTCLGWLVLLLYFATGVVALVRLKTTPAGLLIGGSLVLESVASAVMRILRSVLLTPETLIDADYARAYGMYSITSSCIHMFFTLLTVVGFALLPSSLAKLGALPGRTVSVRGD